MVCNIVVIFLNLIIKVILTVTNEDEPSDDEDGSIDDEDEGDIVGCNDGINTQPGEGVDNDKSDRVIGGSGEII